MKLAVKIRRKSDVDRDQLAKECSDAVRAKCAKERDIHLMMLLTRIRSGLLVMG